MPYLAALVLSVLAPQGQDFGPVIDGAWSPAQIAEKKVSYLFDKMESGKYNSMTFPNYIGKNEVPVLLRMADKKLVLQNFPINPASSQRQQTCTEGIAALWLIEGIRKGGKFPSNNPLCLHSTINGGIADWAEASERNHDDAYKAYARWWAKAQKLPWEKASALNPFAGTDLVWH